MNRFFGSGLRWGVDRTSRVLIARASNQPFHVFECGPGIFDSSQDESFEQDRGLSAIVSDVRAPGFVGVGGLGENIVKDDE